MATFTVHVPLGAAGAVSRAERTIFVRDGFNWPAFLFGPVALLYRRLWIAALVWIVLAVALAGLGRSLHIPPGAEIALFLLLAALTGFEAPALRQRSLARRGFVLADLLSRPSREEAERAFFLAGSTQAPAGPRTPTTGSVRRFEPDDDDVIGLFPRSGDTG